MLAFFGQMYRDGWQIFGRMDENSLMFIHNAKSMVQTSEIRPDFLMEITEDGIRMVDVHRRVVTKVSLNISYEKPF